MTLQQLRGKWGDKCTGSEMAKIVEAQLSQKAMLATIKETKYFDIINSSKQINSTNHELRQCPAYGRMCSSCGKANHFQQACRGSAREAKQGQQNGKPKPIHEAHQRDDACCRGSNEVIDRDIDMVTIKSFNFNSLHSIMETKL